MNIQESTAACDVPCPLCGCDFVQSLRSDILRHARFCRRVREGRETKLYDGCHIVSHRSPIHIQMLLQWAASMAHFEQNHYRHQFAARKDDADPDLTVAAIFVEQGRVKAMIVSRMMSCCGHVDILAEHHVVEQCSEVKRPTINMIWVLRKSRRLGVAKKLIKFMSDHCGTEIDELGHLMPITPEALQLLRGMGLKQIFVV